MINITSITERPEVDVLEEDEAIRQAYTCGRLDEISKLIKMFDKRKNRIGALEEIKAEGVRELLKEERNNDVRFC